MAQKPSIRTKKDLEKINAVDTTERIVRSADKIDVHCERCNTSINVLYNNAVRTLTKTGVLSVCKSCMKSRLSQVASQRTGSKNPFYGKTHTQDAKDKMSDSMISRHENVEFQQQNRIQLQAARASCNDKYNGNAMFDNEVKQKHYQSTHTDEFIARSTELGLEKASCEGFAEQMGKYSDEFWMTEEGSLKKEELRLYFNKEMNKDTGVFYKKRFSNLKAFWQDEAKVAEMRQRFESTCLAKFGVKNPMQNPEINRKSKSRRGMTKPEQVVYKILTNLGIDFQYEPKDFYKLWDFVIYKNGQPDLIIEVDGEYHHALTQDPYNPQNSNHKDEERSQLLPEDVKFLTVDSKKVNKIAETILEMLGVNYQEWVDEMFNYCKDQPFPYPFYEEKRMRKDYSILQNMPVSSNYNNKIIPSNSIVTMFHKSIYSSHKAGRSSPLEAWSDENLLRQCIENRIIYISKWSSYNIARGFEKNKIAPRVSVFQPSLARYLLQRYAPEAKTVLDPMAGFSGRMLGTCSLGMNYTGYDVSSVATKEANLIIDFLKLDAEYIQADVHTLDIRRNYDVLLACPPYGNKEIWEVDKEYQSTDYYIELCLSKFKCKTMIFVVDLTEKYQENIIEEVVNKGHFGEKKEIVLVFNF